MTSRDSQQRKRWSVRVPPTLLPVSKSMHADPHGLGELCLRQSDESPKRGHICSRLKPAEHQALAYT